MITTATVQAARQPAQTAALTLLTTLAVSAPGCFVVLMATSTITVGYAGVLLGLLCLPVAVGVASWQGRLRLSLALLGLAAGLSLLSVVLLGF